MSFLILFIASFLYFYFLASFLIATFAFCIEKAINGKDGLWYFLRIMLIIMPIPALMFSSLFAMLTYAKLY